MRCPSCKHTLATNASFCHKCGFELPHEISEKTVPWYYEPVFVLLSIFLVFAIFGLPLLWKSPKFSHFQKVVISVITVIYTGIIMWSLYYMVFSILLPYYRELNSLL